MRILVYGAGVVGSFYAVQLHQAGHEVTLLARGQRLAGIREHGVVLEDVDTEQQTTASVRVTEQLAPEDAYDLVLVAMRKSQVQSVLPVLAANHHTPSVLFLGNNAAGPDELVTALVRASGVPTPVMDRLYTYLDPTVPLIPDGSAELALHWRG